MNVSSRSSSNITHLTRADTALNKSGPRSNGFSDWWISGNAEAAILLTLSLVVILSNGVTIVTTLFSKKLKMQFHYWFIFNLALTDFLFGFIIQIEAFDSLVTMPKEVCSISIIALHSLSILTLLGTAMLSLNKYIQLFYPFHYPFLITGPRLIGVFATTWLGVFSLLIGIEVASHDDHYKKNGECFPLPANIKISPDVYNVYLTFALVLYVLPLLIISYTNIRITRLVREHTRRMRNQIVDQEQASQNGLGLNKKDLNAIKTALVIVLTFLCMWLPYYTSTIFRGYCGSCVAMNAFSVTRLLSFLNSAVNPILYGFDKTFRTSCKNVFLRLDNTSTNTQTSNS
ncbi:histamine H2 receptor-like [Saccoglossus kowalevskii]|uniref:Histamine H2 receptor-like n=1 Tax=Saccoglossus kowalevskii TaxID=10224 RepID=A0ABM0MGZ1_SACKO|nr:PREDICTED: histamine H2 receptor-like [Saccoglossus kowalevskii]